MHYYTHNIADYRKDTGHLSTLEHGIYRQLIDWYYLDEKPIPVETQVVIRRLRLGSESDLCALQNVLADYFELRDDGYHQTRCDREIASYRSKAQRNRDNGKLGGRPAKTQMVSSGNPDESDDKAKQTLTKNQEPITKNQEKEEARKRATSPIRPADVNVQTWNDWIELRKRKRSPVTLTAIIGARNEAAKAGMTLDAFLQVWCTRGSQGLQAEWLRPDERVGRPAAFSSRADQLARHNAAVVEQLLAEDGLAP